VRVGEYGKGDTKLHGVSVAGTALSSLEVTMVIQGIGVPHLQSYNAITMKLSHRNICVTVPKFTPPSLPLAPGRNLE
jgi:hypothetical protein